MNTSNFASQTQKTGQKNLGQKNLDQKTLGNRTFGLRSLSQIVRFNHNLPIHGPARNSETFGRLLQHWRLIVGDDLARFATPVGLAFDRPKKTSPTKTGKSSPQRGTATLTVRVPRHMALEIHYRQAKILETVEDVFGYPLISRLKIIQCDRMTQINNNHSQFGDALPPPSTADQIAADARTAHLPESELKDAVSRLAARLAVQCRQSP